MRIQISTASSQAVELLQASPLTIFAVFDRSFYASTPQGAILCFAHASLAPGPVTVLCSGWPGSVKEYFTAEMRIAPAGAGHCAMHDADISLELNACSLWEPEKTPPHTLESLQNGLKNAQLLSENAPPHGFAPLLLQVFSRGDAPGAPPPLLRKTPVAQALLDAGSEGLHALARFLARPPDAALCSRSVELLLGLGIGLTPSGDDVLGGAMLALHTLGLHKPQKLLAETIRALGPGSTNPISLAHLHAAAAGQSSAPLHAALHSVMANRSLLAEHMRALSTMGHSSGWDAFTGVCLVLTHVGKTR